MPEAVFNITVAQSGPGWGGYINALGQNVRTLFVRVNDTHWGKVFSPGTCSYLGKPLEVLVDPPSLLADLRKHESQSEYHFADDVWPAIQGQLGLPDTNS